jgi:hypothetical protein
VNLDAWKGYGPKRVEQRNRGVGVGSGIDENAGKAVLRRIADPIEDSPLVIRLARLDFDVKRPSSSCETCVDLVESVAAVDFRLACTEKVEIGARNAENASGHPSSARSVGAIERIR